MKVIKNLLSTLLLMSSPAFSQGPQTPSCGNYIILKDTKIAEHRFTRGTYKINTMGISCEMVMGKYGLLDQFLSQDEGTPLPKPWKYLAEAVGAPKFVVDIGVGFRVQRVSD